MRARLRVLFDNVAEPDSSTVSQRSANFSTGLLDRFDRVLASTRGNLFSDRTGWVDERSPGPTRTRGHFKSTRAANHRTRSGNRNSLSSRRGCSRGNCRQCDRSVRPLVCARRTSAAYRGGRARCRGVARFVRVLEVSKSVVRPARAGDDCPLSSARRAMDSSARRIQFT